MQERQRKSHKSVFERLYNVAERQGGYFTTKQAVAAGFGEKNHPYHVDTGNWIREYRGIYRLANFPNTDRPDLMLWYLWSRNKKDEPQGIYSHETALSLYDLSDVNPANLHMSVPPSFRRNSPLPKMLTLHRGVIHDDEFGWAFGVRVTKPLKTIVDLLTDRTVQMDHIRQAVQQAFQRGLITDRQIESADRIPDSIKKEIQQLKTVRNA